MEAVDPPEALEARIRELAEADRFRAALTCAIEGYGAEVLGYLHAVANRDVDADDAFSEVCEKMWRGLPNFGWRSTFRTWMYAIARNVLRNRVRSHVRQQRVVPLTDAPEVAEVAERVRTTTAVYLRTETKTRLHEVRAGLDPDDRALLVLRVDRKLGWSEIAVVLSDEADLDEPAVAREAARLRKRFERLKAKVTEALREG